MLTTKELQDELAKITYKDDWWFKVYDGDWEGQHLVITTVVDDTYHPGEKTTLDVHSPLPPIPNVEYFHHYLAWRLGRIENHEMREFFKVEGQPVFNPHTEAGNHDRDTYQPPITRRVEGRFPKGELDFNG